jgi:RNA polymerase sigma-70 factor, ECF subfamily
MTTLNSTVSTIEARIETNIRASGCGDHPDVLIAHWPESPPIRFGQAFLRSFLLAMTHGRTVDVVRAETYRCRREQRNMSSRRWIEPEAEDHGLKPQCAARISRAIAELPGAERDAILPAFCGKRTHLETALVLGVPEGTVRSRVQTALIGLRTVLGDLFWPVDDHAA